MEFEFDKEMDSLLRQSAKSNDLFPKQNALTEHIDADEISMFAENALPEKAKTPVIKHLADCDRCRMILSNVIALNSEAETAVVSANHKEAETVVASTEPSWFQKLFSTRNLAFGMGALALIFAVGIGFVFVQNSMNSQTDMAKAEDANTFGADKAAPNEAFEPSVQEQDLNSNVASNLNQSIEKSVDDQDGFDAKTSDPATIAAPSRDRNESSNTKNKQSSPIAEELNRDNGARKERGQAAPPPPPPVVSDLMTQSDDAKIKEEDRDEKKDATSEVIEREDSPIAKPKATSPITTRGATEKSRRKLGVSESKAKKLAPSRRVQGKTFVRKNNIWTDTAYQGQRTTTVKRKTAQYRKLDSGLQTIGNNLDGTVVVVWKSKAYKIQ